MIAESECWSTNDFSSFGVLIRGGFRRKWVEEEEDELLCFPGDLADIYTSRLFTLSRPAMHFSTSHVVHDPASVPGATRQPALPATLHATGVRCDNKTGPAPDLRLGKPEGGESQPIRSSPCMRARGTVQDACGVSRFGGHGAEQGSAWLGLLGCLACSLRQREDGVGVVMRCVGLISYCSFITVFEMVWDGAGPSAS